jgi:hypothetical protein
MGSENRGRPRSPSATSTATANREKDLEMLQALSEGHEGIREDEKSAFVAMIDSLERWVCLTRDQRSWVRDRYEELVKSGAIVPPLREVPRGKEVQSMVGPLPKRPPQRRGEES